MLLKVLDDFLSRLEAIEPRVRSGGGGHFSVEADDDRLFQLMPFADLKVGGIVRRGDLYRTGAERRFDRVIEDQGDRAVHERQPKLRVTQRAVAFIVRIDGHGLVAQQRFRPRGSHNHVAKS